MSSKCKLFIIMCMGVVYSPLAHASEIAVPKHMHIQKASSIETYSMPYQPLHPSAPFYNEVEGEGGASDVSPFGDPFSEQTSPFEAGPVQGQGQAPSPFDAPAQGQAPSPFDAAPVQGQGTPAQQDPFGQPTPIGAPTTAESQPSPAAAPTPAIPSVVGVSGLNFKPPPQRNGAANTSSRVNAPTAAEQQAIEDQRTIIYKSMEIIGATAISKNELMLLWPYLPDEKVSSQDLFVFAEDISTVYREAGYALSFAIVPEQTIDAGEGNFTIRVVEGFIDKVTYKGRVPRNVYSRVANIMDPLLEEYPAKSHSLEERLLIANDFYGVKAVGMLSPSDAANAARLTVDLAHNPFSFTVGMNNYLSDNLDNNVISLSGDVYGLLTGADVIRLSTNFSPDGEAFKGYTLMLASYFGDAGFNAGTTISVSETEPTDESLQDLGFTSEVLKNELFLSYPIYRSRKTNFTYGASYSASETKTFLFDVPDTEETVESLSTWLDINHRIGGGHSVELRLGLVNGLSAEESGTSTSDSGNDPSASAVDIYGKAILDVGRIYNGRFSIPVSFYAQSSLGSKPLLSSAECSFGGRRFGLGFRSSVIYGDSCTMWSARLSWVKGLRSSVLNTYLVYDSGETEEFDLNLEDEDRIKKASSAALGFSLAFRNGVSLTLEGGKGIDLPEETDEAENIFSAALQWRF